MTVLPLLALAASPRDWAQRLHRHVSEHGGARIRLTVLTAAEAIDERYDILLADDRTSYLSARTVTQLHQAGKRVLGFFDPDDPRGKGDLLDWGVDDALAADASVDEILAAVAALAPSRQPGEQPGTNTAEPVPAAARQPTHGARIVVVEGPDAGCGRTEVALGLAAQLAVLDRPTILVELDEARAGLAPRLALAPYPNLRAAVDWSRRHHDPVAALQRPAAYLGVLVAGPAPQPVAPLPPDDVLTLLHDLGAQASWLVVDCGGVPLRPPDGQYASVMVARGTPLGAVRLRAALRSHHGPPPHVVFNHCPDDAYRRWELIEDCCREAVVASVSTLPDDRHVSGAVWRGKPANKGRFTRRLAALAARLAAPEAPA